MFRRQRSYSNYHLAVPMINISQRSQLAGSVLALLIIFHILVVAWLSSNTDLDAEIQARLNSASGAFGGLRTQVFNNRDIYINIKIKVYKDIILPSLLYGSDAWTTYFHHLKSLEKYHQQCLRRILNIKWQDRRTNSSVLAEANVTSIESILIWISRTKFVGLVILYVCPCPGFPRRSFMENCAMGSETKVVNENVSRIIWKTTWNDVLAAPRTRKCRPAIDWDGDILLTLVQSTVSNRGRSTMKDSGSKES